MQTPNTGPILIADITGYSRYLNESELIHAEQTLSSLMSLLVEQTRPPLVVSKTEGDAVLSYGLEGKALSGQAFMDSLEAGYVGFRRAIELMVINTSCDCNACANISNLDLKFFVHHGEFVLSDSAVQAELVGPDVNLVHRLLKNSVTAATGITAYILYTSRAVESLGLSEMVGTMAQHVEVYEDAGTVECWVEDLGPVWERARSHLGVVFEPTEVAIEVSTVVDVPQESVWAYLIDPAYRKTLIGSDRQEVTGLKDGRVGSGSTYLCYHGQREVTQVILDWEPIRRMVTADTMNLLGSKIVFPLEYLLEAEGNRTKLTQRGVMPDVSGVLGWLVRTVYPTKRKDFQRDIDAFGELIERTYHEEAGAQLVSS